MKIEIDLKIILLMFALAIFNILELYSIVLISIIIHEFAHLICGIFFKLKLKKIKFNMFGFSIEFKDDLNKKCSNLKQVIISAAGPIINFCIAIGAIFLFNINENLRENIVYANILLGIINLIPIYPLDGGRIVKCVISIIKGEHYGKIKINKISNTTILIVTVITSFMIVYLKNYLVLIAIIYLWYIVIIENQKFRISMKIFNILENSRNYNIN